jgi:hypothetical protein
MKIGDKVKYVGNDEGRGFNSELVGLVGKIVDIEGDQAHVDTLTLLGKMPFLYNLKIINNQLDFSFTNA